MPDSKRSPMLDLELLELDATPTFVIQAGVAVLPFDLLYANRAFRQGSFRETILAGDRKALQFRSWAQALGQTIESEHELAGYIWSAQIAPSKGELKAIRATRAISNERPPKALVETRINNSPSDPWAESEGAFRRQADQDERKAVYHSRLTMLRSIPRTNLNARWEGIQKMMEMCDVGVFEYGTDGHLMHANEAWYRLR
jgi:hypothetical protein